MKPAEALRVVANEFGRDIPRPIQAPAFADLPPEIQRELQELLGPMQARGVPLELDPRLPDTVGVLLEGRVFRVSVATHPTTLHQRVVILGPDLAPWEKDAFLALCPDEAPSPEPVAVALPALRTLARPQAQILEDILQELRALNAKFR